MSVHVAAMPFPSHQGTQGSIASMLQCLADRGDQPVLWTYAHDANSTDHNALPFTVKRLWDLPRDRSLHSGPSVNKVLLDVQLAARLRLWHRGVHAHDLQPVFAHHVEAAAAAWLARVPYVFVAHTDLAAELPTYAPPTLPPLLSRALQRAGQSLDHFLAQRAVAVAGISPLLARTLSEHTGRHVHYLPVPWPTRASNTQHATVTERQDARAALGLSPDHAVLLYAGNLDRYQGWEFIVDALGHVTRTHPHARLLVATGADTTTLREHVARAHLNDRVVLTSNLTDNDRARCHAAADLYLVPRRTPGGLPIKLLDAIARGVPVIAMERACAGLALEAATTIVPNDDAHALALATTALLNDSHACEAQRHRATAYLQAHHSPTAFLSAHDAIATARTR